MKLTKWFIRILLYFCKIEYLSTDDRIDLEYRIVFKRLFGKVYISQINAAFPPTHINCRCQIIPIEK